MRWFRADAPFFVASLGEDAFAVALRAIEKVLDLLVKLLPQYKDRVNINYYREPS